MYRPLRPRLAFAFTLTLALGLAACGEEAPTSPSNPSADADSAQGADASVAAPHPIRFVQGLAAGIEAAGDPDALLFVCVMRHRPT